METDSETNGIDRLKAETDQSEFGFDCRLVNEETEAEALTQQGQRLWKAFAILVLSRKLSILGKQRDIRGQAQEHRAMDKENVLRQTGRLSTLCQDLHVY